MGRKKIPVAILNDAGKRKLSFRRRQVSLYKKALELSIICNCEIALFVWSEENHLTIYSSEPIDQIFTKVMNYEGQYYQIMRNMHMDPNDKDSQTNIYIKNKSRAVVLDDRIFTNGLDAHAYKHGTPHPLTLNNKMAHTFDQLETYYEKDMDPKSGKGNKKPKVNKKNDLEDDDFGDEDIEYDEGSEVE